MECVKIILCTPFILEKYEGKYLGIRIFNATFNEINKQNLITMLLNLEVIGNLGADAVIKEFDGVKFISFSVAHTEKTKTKEGKEFEKTTWVSCLKRIGEDSKLIDYLKKGSLVYCSGKVKVTVYETQNKEWNAGLNCMVQTLKLLVTKKEDGVGHEMQASAEHTAVNKDDLPF